MASTVVATNASFAQSIRSDGRHYMKVTALRAREGDGLNRIQPRLNRCGMDDHHATILMFKE